MQRKIVCQFYGKDNTLKLYTPYLQISILPRKKTETGEHDLKLCLSVGREFNEEKARKFFNSNDPSKEKILKAFSRETGLSVKEILEKCKKEGLLKRVVVDWIEKKIKQFNIPVTVIRSDKGFQIYEMFKTNDFTEIMQVFWIMVMFVGAGLRLFGDGCTIEEIEDLMRRNVGKFLRKGFLLADSFLKGGKNEARKNI